MAAIVIVSAAAVELGLVVVAVALARAAGASDPDVRRAWLEEPAPARRDRRRAAARAWSGPERRRHPHSARALPS
jgi:hypothetical protein